MNFQSFKDTAGIGAIALIIGWSGSQLRDLTESVKSASKELVEMRSEQKFHAYRLDEHLNRITNAENDIAKNKMAISRLQMKVLGREIAFFYQPQGEEIYGN